MVLINISLLILNILKLNLFYRWENLQGTSNSGVSAPVLGLLLSEGPLRIITQGQELTSEYDERSLGDAGFKDNQVDIKDRQKLFLYLFTVFELIADCLCITGWTWCTTQRYKCRSSINATAATKGMFTNSIIATAKVFRKVVLSNANLRGYETKT